MYCRRRMRLKATAAKRNDLVLYSSLCLPYYCWIIIICRIFTEAFRTGCSGLVAAQEVLGSNPRGGQVSVFVFTKFTAIRSFGHRCTPTAVFRLTQPFILRGTANEYQPYGWVLIQMAMGECSAYSSLQADSKVQFAAWPTSWRPPGADRISLKRPEMNSRNGFAQ